MKYIFFLQLALIIYFFLIAHILILFINLYKYILELENNQKSIMSQLNIDATIFLSYKIIFLECKF